DTPPTPPHLTLSPYTTLFRSTLARALRVERPDLPVEIAFLEFARPTIQEGFDRLVGQGFRNIVVLPGVLMAAGHAKNDMASEVQIGRAHVLTPVTDQSRIPPS